MADLEEMGLLQAPHSSAGRLPTEAGLSLFVHGILEIGALGEDEQRDLEDRFASVGGHFDRMLEQAGEVISGLSSCAGLVLAPKIDRPLRQIDFVHLGPGRAMVVLVTEDGMVENRVMEVPLGIPSSSLTMAGNFLTTRLAGRTLDETRAAIEGEIMAHQAQLDELAARVVQQGLAIWLGQGENRRLIVRGRSQLLKDVEALGDLDRIGRLFEALEMRRSMTRLIELTKDAEGVQIFVGAENAAFAGTGCSLVVSPYLDSQERIIGAVGVIGPTRMNYARIVPMVDYTAQLLGRLIAPPPMSKMGGEKQERVFNRHDEQRSTRYERSRGILIGSRQPRLQVRRDRSRDVCGKHRRLSQETCG